MLLIHPPVAKACEPPAGIARLAGALQGHHIPYRLLDANLEGMLWLLGRQAVVDDTWTRRAAKNVDRNLAALRDDRTFRSPDRYGRAVREINRLLAVSGGASGAHPGLADYQDRYLSPIRSVDLLRAADRHEDNPFFPYFSERLEEILADPAAAHGGVVGISLNYLSQALCTFALVGFLRARFPRIRVVLGGGLITSWQRRPDWRNPFAGLVDDLVAGPGELPLLELCGSGSGAAAHALPEYGQLPLSIYLAPGLILPYSAASGCYWNRCSFCPERAEGNGYHPVPTSQALDEIHELIARNRPVLLHLLDNAVSPALLRGLTDRPPGVPWYGFARFGRELADPGFCRALRQSGCVMLKLGLESGDQGVLDRLEKGIDLEQAEQVLTNLQRAGIGVYLYLLFGTPAETEPAARQTLAFVQRNRAAIDFLNLALFNMPVSGDEAEIHATEPFYDGDLSLYTGFRHPGGWDRKEVRRFLEREFKRDPAVAAILRRDPPFFTSNLAPFCIPARSDALLLGS